MTTKETEAKPMAIPSNFKKADTDLDNYPDWDFEKHPSLHCIVDKVKDVTVSRKGKADQDTQLAVIDVGGVKHLLWRSANLDKFFEDIGPGSEIMVVYRGMEPLKHGRTMKMFDAYIAE